MESPAFYTNAFSWVQSDSVNKYHLPNFLKDSYS